jgi:hypothetical protein
MDCLTMIACVGLLQHVTAPVDLTRALTEEPVVVTELRSERYGGFPTRLSWSPDGETLYVRFVKRDRWANETTKHAVIRVADGAQSLVDGEPAWASAYWLRKSGYTCPGALDFAVSAETRTERRTPTSAGSSGSIGQNTGDPYAPGFELGPQGQAIVASAMQAQYVTTTTMKLRGQLISEFVNTEAVPGLMFGWAPEGLAAVAYGDRKRHLVIQERSGRRHQIRDTQNVLLPAWSDDGKTLAWIEQRAQGVFSLRAVRLAQQWVRRCKHR